MRWHRAAFVLSALVAVALVASSVTIFLVAPREATMGLVQKIFYVHVPSAMSMMLLFGVCGLASLGFMISGGSSRHSRVMDAIAVACAEVGLMFGVVVLTTGPIWAKKAWGTYWTWEPRLTLVLMVFLLFLAYLALRAFAGAGHRMISAGMAVMALPGLYFIHVAVQRWGGAHPQVVFKGGLQVPQMKLALAVSVAAMTLLSALLVLLRTRLELSRGSVDRLFLDMS